MKDQHEKIAGYRSLSQEEIDLMNEAKALERKVIKYTRRLKGTSTSIEPDPRWLALGITHLEFGFMAVIRSIAKPQNEPTDED